MLAAYGVDVLSPQVTPRRIDVLMQRLPPQFRLPGEVWSTEADLLAQLCDEIAMLTWVTLRAAGAKGAAKPRPIKRPPRRLAPGRGGGSAARRAADEQSSTSDTWMDAARQLVAIPGVIVSDG